GRLPVRVELTPLTKDDMHRILTETEFNLIQQQIEMLKTENCKLTFTKEAVLEIAHTAVRVNDQVENIGARRLVTVIEKLLFFIFLIKQKKKKNEKNFYLFFECYEQSNGKYQCGGLPRKQRICSGC
ncbi:heat shock protein HslVU, ATPase subunit HslU, partial [Reticulomyxa filosa]